MTNLAMQVEWAVTEPESECCSRCGGSGGAGDFPCPYCNGTGVVPEPTYPPVPRWWVECEWDECKKFADYGAPWWSLKTEARYPMPSRKGIRPMTSEEARDWYTSVLAPFELDYQREGWDAAIEYKEATR